MHERTQHAPADLAGGGVSRWNVQHADACRIVGIVLQHGVQHVRLRRSKIVSLAWVIGQVIQVPAFIAKWQPVAHQLHCALVQGRTPGRLHADGFVCCVGVFCAPRKHGQQTFPADCGRRRWCARSPGVLEQGGRNVADEGKRVMASARRNARTGHDQRHTHAAFSGVELEQGERCCVGVCRFGSDCGEGATRAEMCDRGAVVDAVQPQAEQGRGHGVTGLRAIVRKHYK